MNAMVMYSGLDCRPAEGFRTVLCQPNPDKPRRRRMVFDLKGRVMPPLNTASGWNRWTVQEVPEGAFIIESLSVPRSTIQNYVGRVLGPRRLPIRALSEFEIMSLLNQLTPEQENFLRGK